MATTMTKKNPTNKITYAQAFTAILDVLGKMNPNDILATVTVAKDTTAPLTVATAIEKVEQQIGKYGRKSSAPKKPSTASIQNAQYAEILLAYLRKHSGVGFTSTELCDVEGMPDGCSTPKITAIMRTMPEGAVSTDKVKGRNVYFIPSATAEE